MLSFEIDFAWDIDATPYQDHDFMHLGGEWNSSGLLPDRATGQRLRDVQLLLHTPLQTRNAVRWMEALDPPLEYVNVHWAPPDWIVSIQEWADTHGLAALKWWIDDIGDDLVEWLCAYA
jgi:hypothetical protein